MARAVILAAGRATRLGGVNKLLVEAGGLPVHEWHRRALEGYDVGAVVRPADADAVRTAAPWLTVVEHELQDGPAGALLAYITANPEHGPLTVIYADTLLPSVPSAAGDWVATAKAPGRVWDYWDGDWTRGVPWVEVCVGAYQFACVGCLVGTLRRLLAQSGGEVHLADVLREYDIEHLIQRLRVEGWQDAGDPEAIARVKPIGD